MYRILLAVAMYAAVTALLPTGASAECVYWNGTDISVTIQNCRDALPPID